jgi:hypothetical protein
MPRKLASKKKYRSDSGAQLDPARAARFADADLGFIKVYKSDGTAVGGAPSGQAGSKPHQDLKKDGPATSA